MECKNCGSKLILKYTNTLRGNLVKYWKCPVCGAENEQIQKNRLGEVLLK